jgi:hypothetical protein
LYADKQHGKEDLENMPSMIFEEETRGKKDDPIAAAFNFLRALVSQILQNTCFCLFVCLFVCFLNKFLLKKLNFNRAALLQILLYILDVDIKYSI